METPSYKDPYFTTLNTATLHFTTLVDVSLSLKLHPTTLHYPLTWLNPI
jgi:hypothetical protein